MSDIKKKQKELVSDLAYEMNWESGLGECPGVDEAFMTEPPDYLKERLEKLLGEYIDDDNNYIVEGAYVTCDQMSKEPVQMYYRDGKLGIEGEGGSAEIEYEKPEGTIISLPRFEIDITNKEIGSFHAINSKQTANGLRFATISDRSCLRERTDKMLEEERENKEKEETEKKKSTVFKVGVRDIASLTSMGNCKIMWPSDVLKIKEKDAQIYGTCYCLMQPGAQWINPYCMESIVENCDTEGNDTSELLNQFASGADAVLNKKICYHTSHHQTMKWDVDGREEEGLTRLSTLLCLRGGIITFTDSGQSIQKFYEKDVVEEESIEVDVEGINIGDTLSEEEIIFIATIYGEGTTYSTETRQALAHTIMNRVGVREWSRQNTVTKVIQNTGFDAYGGALYKEAKAYLDNRDYSNETIESIINVVLPIYRGEQEDTTNNAVLFYSPNAQAQLCKQNPSKYKNPPSFVNDKVEEVVISGTENDDIKFYRYKD